MANFNSSFWYHLYIKRDKTRSLAATNLSSRNETMGATLYKSVDKNNATQRWQWYGINSTTYVLRCEVGGPDAFLGTKYEPSETTPGQTQAVMVRGNVSDNSVYWTVSPWEDGTFFMTNGENGTDWHLEKMRSGSIALSSNVTAPQDGQRWSFEAIEAINDDNYSTISLPSKPTLTPPTNTNPADPTQTTNTNLANSTQTTYTSPSDSTQTTKTNPADSTHTTTSHRSGLSTSAKAGIGTGIGLLALIAITALFFFLLRRRKQQNMANLYGTEQNNNIGGGGQEISSGGKCEMGNEEARHEIAQGESLKYGQRGTVTYEMSATQAPVELPSSKVGIITQL